MRTVKTKKELIQAINDGEKEIMVDDPKLYAACVVAEKYQNKSDLLKSIVDTGTTQNVITETGIIIITIAVLITALAIIAVLKDRVVIIKCRGKKGRGGEINIL